MCFGDVKLCSKCGKRTTYFRHEGQERCDNIPRIGRIPRNHLVHGRVYRIKACILCRRKQQEEKNAKRQRFRAELPRIKERMERFNTNESREMFRWHRIMGFYPEPQHSGTTNLRWLSFSQLFEDDRSVPAIVIEDLQQEIPTFQEFSSERLYTQSTSQQERLLRDVRGYYIEHLRRAANTTYVRVFLAHLWIVDIEYQTRYTLRYSLIFTGSYVNFGSS